MGTGDGQTLLAKVGSVGAENFPMRSSLFLHSVRAVYKLRIEIQSPLDMVILRSPSILELEESNPQSVIPSTVPFEYSDSNTSLINASETNYFCSKFVVIYTCRNGEKKLDINFRPREGYIFGDLTVVVSIRGNSKAA